MNHFYSHLNLRFETVTDTQTYLRSDLMEHRLAKKWTTLFSARGIKIYSLSPRPRLESLQKKISHFCSTCTSRTLTSVNHGSDESDHVRNGIAQVSQPGPCSLFLLLHSLQLTFKVKKTFFRFCTGNEIP